MRGLAEAVSHLSLLLFAPLESDLGSKSYDIAQQPKKAPKGDLTSIGGCLSVTTNVLHLRWCRSSHKGQKNLCTAKDPRLPWPSFPAGFRPSPWSQPSPWLHSRSFCCHLSACPPAKGTMVNRRSLPVHQHLQNERSNVRRQVCNETNIRSWSTPQQPRQVRVQRSAQRTDCRRPNLQSFLAPESNLNCRTTFYELATTSHPVKTAMPTSLHANGIGNLMTG